MNDFDVPDDRAIPADVLDRLDQKITLGIDAPQPRQRSRTPWLAAAAVVTALAAGAIVVTNQGQDTEPAADPQMNAALDRCWAVVQSQGRAAQFPNRASWRGVFQVVDQSNVKATELFPGPLGSTVTAIRAANKPFFCEESGNGVTITDPNAAAVRVGGSQTGILLAGRTGTVAGVADPTWKHVNVDITPAGEAPPGSIPGMDIRMAGEAQLRDGMFVFTTGFALNWGGADLPVKVTDGHGPAPAPVHVPWPAVGTTTAQVGIAHDCLEHARRSQPVEAPGSWTDASSAQIQGNGSYTYTYVNAKGDLGACYDDGNGTARFEIYPTPPVGDQHKPVVAHVARSGDGWSTVVGRVAADVVEMTMSFPGGKEEDVQNLARSTFTVALPPSVRAEDVVCKVYVREGNKFPFKVVYEGPLLTK
jgi:hypothetical protein